MCVWLRRVPTKRGEPRPAAFKECVRPADLLFNCRDFFDRDHGRRQVTWAHIGSHPIIMAHLAEYRQFRNYMRRAATAIRNAMSRRQPEVVFAAWCRAGEKRSVAMALHLWHAVAEVTGVESTLIHSCDGAWGRQTCAGTCPECRSPLRPEMREASP